MEFTILGIGILTWITFLPAVGMVAVLLLPKGSNNAVRWTSLGFTVLQVILAVIIFARFDRTMAGMQFVEKGTWIDVKSVAWFGRVHIEYFLGIDGISVVMVLLTALISCIAAISSWTIEKSLKGYFALFLLLDTGMMGVFVALDFFLFYVFWEVMLLPMYFLIGVWGGPRREYAAIKFFLHIAGQCVDVAGNAGPLLQYKCVHRSCRHHRFGCRCHKDRRTRIGENTHIQPRGDDRSAELHSRVTARRLGDDMALHRLCRAVHRIRHQDSLVPVPYLVA
jgi:hypothetical protein